MKKTVLRYVNGTKTQKLRLRLGQVNQPTSYVDASWKSKF